MRAVICGVVLLCIGFSASSQEKESNGSVLQPNNFAPISVSYFGNLVIHPGIKLSVDYPLLGVQKIKNKPKKVKTIQKLFFFQPNLAYFIHPKTMSGLHCAIDMGWRRYNNKLFYAEVGTGFGFMTRFNVGETYIANANGEIESVKKATSRTYLTSSLSGGLGKAWFTNNGTSMAAYTKLNTYFLRNYSASTLLETSLEIGIKINPDFGVKAKPIKIIKKEK